MLSGLSEVTGPDLILLSSVVKPAFVMLWSPRIRLTAGVAEAKMPIIRCSTERYSSPMDLAALAAALMARLSSLEA